MIRRLAIGLLWLLWLLGLAHRVCAAPPDGRPNIVFLLADDLGYGDLHCYGRQDVRTPSIDRLAAEGVRFTQAYANGPECSPTRMEEHLFDLAQDPDEQQDLCATRPHDVTRLAARLAEWEDDVKPARGRDP